MQFIMVNKSSGSYLTAGDGLIGICFEDNDDDEPCDLS
jgi:hypothetical protein